jgi:hypothetical protein
VSSNGANPTFNEHDVVAEQGVDEFPDAVVGQAAVESCDQVGGGEVADPVPGFGRGDAERHEHVALPVPAGPIRQPFSAARTHSRETR